MRFCIIPALVVAASLMAQTATFDELSARAEGLVDKDPAQAVGFFKEALAMRPEWAKGWLYMGASFFHLGRFSEARDALTKGAALEPDKGTPRAFIGLSDFELGDYDAALMHMLEGERIGLADNPAFVATVRYHTALLYIRRNDFHHAVEHLQPLAGNIDRFPEILNLLGAGALKMPSPIPEKKAALVTLAGKATFAYYALHLDDAKALFGQLEKEYPSEPGVHYAEGIYLLHDEPDRALVEFQQELAMQPESVFAMQQIALLLIKKDRNAEAVEMAAHAVAKDSSNAQCQAALGRALLASGNTNAAIAALERAVKLAVSDPQMHFHLEQAYRRGGRLEDAKREKSEFHRLRELNDPLEVTPSSLPQ